jgi:hypothetical protein
VQPDGLLRGSNVWEIAMSKVRMTVAAVPVALAAVVLATLAGVAGLSSDTVQGQSPHPEAPGPAKTDSAAPVPAKTDAPPAKTDVPPAKTDVPPAKTDEPTGKTETPKKPDPKGKGDKTKEEPKAVTTCVGEISVGKVESDGFGTPINANRNTFEGTCDWNGRLVVDLKNATGMSVTGLQIELLDDADKRVELVVARISGRGETASVDKSDRKTRSVDWGDKLQLPNGQTVQVTLQFKMAPAKKIADAAKTPKLIPVKCRVWWFAGDRGNEDPMIVEVPVALPETAKA